jgi:hypothetical protein
VYCTGYTFNEVSSYHTIMVRCDIKDEFVQRLIADKMDSILNAKVPLPPYFITVNYRLSKKLRNITDLFEQHRGTKHELDVKCNYGSTTTLDNYVIALASQKDL